MFAVYKGKQYKLVKERKFWELISKNSESFEDGFVKDGNLFYKQISDFSVLDSAYDIWMVVEYDTHFDKVPKEWRLDESDIYFDKEYSETKVKLLFAEGSLPGWKVEEKNVCSKYVNVNEISAAYIVRKNIISGSEEKEAVNVSDILDIFNNLKKEETQWMLKKDSLITDTKILNF